jgi:hypothetical protein
MVALGTWKQTLQLLQQKIAMKRTNKVLMKSEVFTSVTVQSTSLWDATPYSLVDYFWGRGLFFDALSSKTNSALNGSVMMKDVLESKWTEPVVS